MSSGIPAPHGYGDGHRAAFGLVVLLGIVFGSGGCTSRAGLESIPGANHPGGQLPANTVVTAVVVLDGRSVVAATSEGFARSTNAGASWVVLDGKAEAENVFSIAIDSAG
jgi:hypothetical protein